MEVLYLNVASNKNLHEDMTCVYPITQYNLNDHKVCVHVCVWVRVDVVMYGYMCVCVGVCLMTS